MSMAHKLYTLLFSALLALVCLAAAADMARAAVPSPGGPGGVPSRSPQVYPTVGPIKSAPGASYALSLSGTAVHFDLSGFEPDFDPLYTVTVSATAHDRRPAPLALPDATLILSSYLEVFQPDTTPILPDLLHPDQVANDLAGFLSGKAALVNAGGLVVYRGSLLAEIFQDNTEHLVVDLYPVTGGRSVRLQGVITLHKGGAEDGTLRALQPLARRALAVPPGKAPSWQSVVSGLGVKRPAMMGTAGSPAQHTQGKTTTPATFSPSRHAAKTALLPLPFALALGGILIFVILAGPGIWRRYGGRTRSLRTAQDVHGIGRIEDAGAEDAAGTGSG